MSQFNFAFKGGEQTNNNLGAALSCKKIPIEEVRRVTLYYLGGHLKGMVFRNEEGIALARCGNTVDDLSQMQVNLGPGDRIVGIASQVTSQAMHYDFQFIIASCASQQQQVRI